MLENVYFFTMYICTLLLKDIVILKRYSTVLNNKYALKLWEVHLQSEMLNQ